MKKILFMIHFILAFSVYGQNDVTTLKTDLLALSDEELFAKAHGRQVGSCAILDATGSNCPQCACNYYSKKLGSNSSSHLGIPAETGCLVIPGMTMSGYDGSSTSRCTGSLNCVPSLVERENGARHIRWALNESGDYCDLQKSISQVFSQSSTVKQLVIDHKIRFTKLVSTDKKPECFSRGLVPDVNVTVGGSTYKIEPFVPKGPDFCQTALNIHKALGKKPVMISLTASLANRKVGNLTKHHYGVAQGMVDFSTLNEEKMRVHMTKAKIEAGIQMQNAVLINKTSDMNALETTFINTPLTNELPNRKSITMSEALGHILNLPASAMPTQE
jgi:hypothetical protein